MVGVVAGIGVVHRTVLDLYDRREGDSILGGETSGVAWVRTGGDLTGPFQAAEICIR
jgi:hypothetical protein